jgi:hypothetical protein
MAKKKPIPTNQRKQRLQAEVGAFVRQYARKRQKGHDPNDRQYDRKLEKNLRRMKPELLDDLINGDE